MRIRWLVLISVSLLLNGCFGNTSHTGEKVKPNLTAAGYNVQLGIAYLHEGFTERAKSKLMLALQQAPTWPPAQDAMAYFLEMTGDPKRAEQLYLKAIDLDPKSGVSHNNYGTFLCRNRHYEEAEKHFLLAVQDPNYINSSEAYENAGLCVMEIPDNQKAQQYFRKALQQDPRRSTSALELATVNYKIGDYALAKTYLARYMKMTNPEPQALWLGMRIAQKLNDKIAAAHYQQLLNAKFPEAKAPDFDKADNKT